MAELLAQGPLPGQKMNLLLKDGERVRLGRDVANGWSIPWDKLLSRQHVDLLIEGDELRVMRLENALNPVIYKGVASSDFRLTFGEEFQIGETVFQLRNDPKPVVSESTVESQFQSIAPEELHTYQFDNAKECLEVLSRLPDLISHAGSQENFPKRLIDLLLEAIPKAEAAAIIVDQTDENSPEEKTLSVRFQSQRKKKDETLHSPVDVLDVDNKNFHPSHRLVRTALKRRECQYYVWSGQDGTDAPYTLKGDFNWAFCIPIEAEACTDWCLYLTGRKSISLNSSSSDSLRGDLRLAELIGQIMGSILQVRLLEDRQSKMTQFFSPKVVKALRNRHSEDSLVPKEGKTTILFCDLRGFSRKSEKEQNDLFALMERVSEALGVMTRNIIAHDGVIADFQGDAALGFWGWPIPPEDGPLAACRTALAINQEFAAAAQDPSATLAAFRVGIGIAHGMAISGTIGTKDQVELGVFGPVVNLASRLESMTKQLRVPILIDETTADYLRDHSSATEVRFRRMCRIRPYGMETALTVSQLIPPVQEDSTISDDLIACYEDALESFIEGRWSETLDKLGELPVSDRAKDFLMIYIATNNYEAPIGWDGVISLSSK